MTKLSQVTFERPPLNEVVLGFRFNSDAFTPVHYGLFWEKFKINFPKVSTQAPIFAQEEIETFSSSIPLPRVWFESENQEKLIQVQGNRLHFNWRRHNDDQPYPRFETLLPEFLKIYEAFEGCAKSSVLPFEFKISTLELTYINHFDKKSGWSGPEDNQKVLLPFSFGTLPQNVTPLGCAANLGVNLPEKVGALFFDLKQGLRKDSGENILVADLTVRARFEGQSLRDWFISAHNELVRFFVTITPPDAQKRWGFLGERK